jgi:hypothetical protein
MAQKQDLEEQKVGIDDVKKSKLLERLALSLIEDQPWTALLDNGIKSPLEELLAETK